MEGAAAMADIMHSPIADFEADSMQAAVEEAAIWEAFGRVLVVMVVGAAEAAAEPGPDAEAVADPEESALALEMEWLTYPCTSSRWRRS